jgi:hypothetical protein
MPQRNVDDRPFCKQNRTDCFAFLQRTGRCFALQDTEFKNGKICPFYKKENEVDPRIIAEKYMEDN